MPTQSNTKDSSETWKAIPGFEGYEVSDQGQVRSYLKRGRWYKGEIGTSPRLLKPAIGLRSGYRGVNLRHDGQSHFKRVARLVLLAFVSPCPNGMEVCHNNGNPSDDRLENLRYDTHLGNMRDRLSLSDAQVIAMRERRAQGERISTIAQSVGIDHRKAYSICRGISYRAIGGPFTAGWGRRGVPVDNIVAIRTERANSDITLKELGKKYGLSESCTSRICRGEYYPNDEGPITANMRTISTDNIIAMRIERAHSNIALKDLGKKYSVSLTTAGEICRGRRYPNDGGPITVGKIVRKTDKSESSHPLNSP